MRARDLAQPYPTVHVDTPATEAGRLLAEEATHTLFVKSLNGRLRGVLHDRLLLAHLLPPYVEEDQALARVLGEAAADVLWKRLDGFHVEDLLPLRGTGIPRVNADDNLVEVASVLVRTGSPLVAVYDSGRLLGGISAAELVTRLLHPK